VWRLGWVGGVEAKVEDCDGVERWTRSQPGYCQTSQTYNNWEGGP
jgi:hypothetical protein